MAQLKFLIVHFWEDLWDLGIFIIWIRNLESFIPLWPVPSTAFLFSFGWAGGPLNPDTFSPFLSQSNVDEIVYLILKPQTFIQIWMNRRRVLEEIGRLLRESSLTPRIFDLDSLLAKFSNSSNENDLLPLTSIGDSLSNEDELRYRIRFRSYSSTRVLTWTVLNIFDLWIIVDFLFM